MSSWPPKVRIHQDRHRGFVRTTSLVALTPTLMYFVPVKHDFEEAENTLISEGWVGPSETVHKGLYDRDKYGSQFLQFWPPASEVNNVELIVISAFLHNEQLIKEYRNPVLLINGCVRGRIGALVDGFRRS